MLNFQWKPGPKLLGFSLCSGCVASTHTKAKPRCDKWVGGSGACSECNQWDWGTKSLKFCISTLSFSLNSLKISQIKPRKATFKQTSQLTAHNVL